MTSLTDLHRQLEIMRPLLLRFALLQLRNKTTAEDAVQETLLAILEKPDSFARGNPVSAPTSPAF